MGRGGAAYLASGALHALVFAAIARLPPPRPHAEVVAVEVIETERRAAEPAPKPEPPRPPATPPPRALPRRIALAPPDDAPRPPVPADAPPPPHASPPAATTTENAPVRVGIALSGSTSAGRIAAPVGNTLYGRMPATAPDPASVQPYRADHYVPPTQVTVMPRLIGGPPRLSKDDYPPEAVRLELEGRVLLMVTVDTEGKVADVRVLEDPGHGFGEAAVRVVRKYYRFQPARRGDQPVATTVRVPVTFEIQ